MPVLRCLNARPPHNSYRGGGLSGHCCYFFYWVGTLYYWPMLFRLEYKLREVFLGVCLKLPTVWSPAWLAIPSQYPSRISLELWWRVFGYGWNVTSRPHPTRHRFTAVDREHRLTETAHRYQLTQELFSGRVYNNARRRLAEGNRDPNESHFYEVWKNVLRILHITWRSINETQKMVEKCRWLRLRHFTIEENCKKENVTLST